MVEGRRGRPSQILSPPSPVDGPPPASRRGRRLSRRNNRMNYLAQRLLTFPLILLGVSVLVFVAIRMVPGDAITAMLGTEAGLLTPAQQQALANYFGIDQPIHIQYWRWLMGLFQGDLGVSATFGRPVLPIILERFPLTLELAILAMLIALAVGVPAGVFRDAQREDERSRRPHLRDDRAIDAELRFRPAHHLRSLGLFRLPAGHGARSCLCSPIRSPTSAS